MRARDVLLRLVHEELGLPGDYQVELIQHEVSVNWRQLNSTPRPQIAALPQSLHQSGPFAGERIAVADLASALPARLTGTAPGQAVSVTSRLWDGSGQPAGHLAMMNLHPVAFRDVPELTGAVAAVVGSRSGHLLASGRYFHYYGSRLLPVDRWPQFLAQFLMPCVLVSPRYIGHSLYRGFCSLRLNAVPPVKPYEPIVI